jgi:predicted Zn-dependent protease
MEDLFEGNTDNFTVGMATGPKDRIGIFSFARYDPEFEEKPSKKSTAQAKQNKAIFLQRSCKVLAHEILHMFGVDHCVWFDCERRLACCVLMCADKVETIDKARLHDEWKWVVRRGL